MNKGTSRGSCSGGLVLFSHFMYRDGFQLLSGQRKLCLPTKSWENILEFSSTWLSQSELVSRPSWHPTNGKWSTVNKRCLKQLLPQGMGDYHRGPWVVIGTLDPFPIYTGLEALKEPEKSCERVSFSAECVCLVGRKGTFLESCKIEISWINQSKLLLSATLLFSSTVAKRMMSIPFQW